MNLKDKVNQDLITAMKAREELRVSTLRLLKSAIMKHEVSAKDAVADDAVVLGLIQKEAKSRKDSMEQFRQGGRNDLAEKEERELKILEAYLPEQMSETGLREVIKATIAETGATSAGDIGKVMQGLMPKIKGRADGTVVNKLVREMLSL